MNLKPVHADFFFTKITERNPNEFRVEDFSCLSDLGKYSLDQGFKEKLVGFFLQIVKNAEKFNEDVQDNAVEKFSEMVKHWDVETKKGFFVELIKSIQENLGCSLTSLIALKQLLEGAIEKVTNSYSSYSSYGYQPQGGSHGDGKTLQERQEELQEWLFNAMNEHKVVETILNDFKAYWTRAR